MGRKLELLNQPTNQPTHPFHGRCNCLFLFGQRVRKIEPIDHLAHQKRPTKHLRTIRRSVVIILWKSCEKTSRKIQFGGRRGSKRHPKTHKNTLKDNAQKDTRKNTENVFILQNDLTHFWNKCHKKYKQ